MNSERLWVVVLVVTSFLAGAAASLFLSIRRFPIQESGPFAVYEALLVEEYEIAPDERQKLRQILDVYHDEVERLKARQLEAFDAELVKAGEDCLARIHDWVIPPERVASFRDHAGLGPTAPGVTPGRPE